jgi:hypothetical protein
MNENFNNDLLYNFSIKNKNAEKVLFTPNKAQLDYLKRRTGRDYILKARQLGFTTLEQLRKLKRVLLEENITVVTVAQKKSKAQEIFTIVKFAWDNLPEEFKEAYKVKYDNVRELDFGMNASKYYVDIDLRSGTVQDLHISELAYIKDIESLFSSSLEAVPKSGTIAIETTANGLNRAYDLWREAVEGKNEFTPHFYNWTWDEGYFETPPEDSKWKEEYKLLAKKYNLIYDIQNKHQLSDKQFYWYFLKARRLKERTKQEYPTISEEAFLSSAISVFDLFKVSQLKAGNVIRTEKGVKIYQEPKKDHKYIIGIDTAEGLGGDNTALHIWDVTDNSNLIEVASLVDPNIRPDQTAQVTIDLGNEYNEAFVIPERNGSGLTTVLKLKEKGYKNLFVNRQIDKKTQKQKNEYGWRTQSSNRDLMIDDFIEFFENDNLTINSQELIQQMKTFVRKSNGKREHDEGYHDDSLFASFLVVQGIKFYRDNEYKFYDRSRLGI